jgi:L-amino acid N-acyltransferase YncA
MIRKAAIKDAKAICQIYNYYVENTIVTFEEVPVAVEEMEQRIRDVSQEFPWIVFEEDGRIEGYAYAGKWKDRYSYRFTLEATVYLRSDTTERGIGSRLYEHLLNEIRQTDCHAVMGVISLPNDKSCRLHEKFGFEKVAHYSEVGFKFGKWIDVVAWELRL